VLLEKITFAGWANCLRFANEHAEVIVTTDVGPRILSYRPLTGRNMLYNYPEQMGGMGESKWMNRGGHRLWIAPEDSELTYALDNLPYPYQVTGENSVKLTSPGNSRWKIRKDIEVELAREDGGVRLVHTLTNETTAPQRLSAWALSVMAPGGISIIPQPPLGEHPCDLLPNRNFVLWPYNDMSDPRFCQGRHFVTLRQDATGVPFKYGCLHNGRWAAYLLGNQLFVKTIAFQTGANYPDMGCNYESFTDSDMIELESLGPLVSVEPGASVSHTESWQIFGELQVPAYSDSPAFAEWLAPYLPA